jgi:Uma2 family endonuclease
MVTSIQQLDRTLLYNYADYLKWQFQERVELLKGILLPMAAPNVRHQQVSAKLTVILGNFLFRKKCQVFTAPFDVRLPLPPHKLSGNKIDTVVQPDLCVICDAQKLDKRGCIGAPDLVVEILSPSNKRREMIDKFELYEAAGVREYWIFDPSDNIVLQYHLDEATGHFTQTARPLSEGDILKSHIFEGLEVNLSEVFPPIEPLEEEEW